MMTTALTGCGLTAAAWCLWVRRATWRSRWELAATLNVALTGCAIALASPASTDTIGAALHHVTGRWNLEDLAAGYCFVFAACAIVYHALSRIADEQTLQEALRQFVERPITVCIPVLLVSFLLSDAARGYHVDFFTAPVDRWLTLYWSVLAGLLVYLLGYALRAFCIVRRDPRSRRAAGICSLGAASALAGWGVQFVGTVVRPSRTADYGVVVWLLLCLAAGTCAVSLAQAWQHKLQWSTRPIVVGRGSRG